MWRAKSVHFVLTLLLIVAEQNCASDCPVGHRHVPGADDTVCYQFLPGQCYTHKEAIALCEALGNGYSKLIAPESRGQTVAIANTARQLYGKETAIWLAYHRATYWNIFVDYLTG